MLSRFVARAKFGGDQTMCTGCRCKNMVFIRMFVFVCLSRSGLVVHCSFEDILWTSIVSRFMGRFWCVSTFFRRDCPLRWTRWNFRCQLPLETLSITNRRHKQGQAFHEVRYARCWVFEALTVVAAWCRQCVAVTWNCSSAPQRVRPSGHSASDSSVPSPASAAARELSSRGNCTHSLLPVHGKQQRQN